VKQQIDENKQARHSTLKKTIELEGSLKEAAFTRIKRKKVIGAMETILEIIEDHAEIQ
jgi:hypothetical protein